LGFAGGNGFNHADRAGFRHVFSDPRCLFSRNALLFHFSFRLWPAASAGKFGVSVMNGILIITYFNEVRRSGMGTIDAMDHAAEQRMRPMLMTALSACIGLLPAAISTGIGSQVQRPLATVVVGGMLIGPIILLVVVPALQTLFLGRGENTVPTPAAVPTEG
jgi:hypothetical protein